MKSLVSVVMNSYRDNPVWLEEAIRSYVHQTGVQVQVIVSTVEGDSAVDVALSEGVEVYVSGSSGIYKQINSALPLVRGDWFTYASGNDVALPTKLEDEMKACLKGGNRVCYSSYWKSDATLSSRKQMKFSGYSYERHLKGNFVSDCALVRTDVLRRFAPFVEKYGNYAYYDFWLRIAEAIGGGTFVYNPVPEWIYRVTPESRHIKKRGDRKMAAQDSRDRVKMLESHGGGR